MHHMCSPLWKMHVKYPVYYPGDPQLRVHMPLFWMAPIYPGADTPPDRVLFRVHPQYFPCPHPPSMQLLFLYPSFLYPSTPLSSTLYLSFLYPLPVASHTPHTLLFSPFTYTPHDSQRYMDRACACRMTAADVKQYLEKIYKLQVLHVTTEEIRNESPLHLAFLYPI